MKYSFEIILLCSNIVKYTQTTVFLNVYVDGTTAYNLTVGRWPFSDQYTTLATQSSHYSAISIQIFIVTLKIIMLHITGFANRGLVCTLFQVSLFTTI